MTQRLLRPFLFFALLLGACTPFTYTETAMVSHSVDAYAGAVHITPSPPVWRAMGMPATPVALYLLLEAPETSPPPFPAETWAEILRIPGQIWDYYFPPPPPPRGKIALTFDDGPSVYTEKILDALATHNGRATFFVLGYRVEPFQETILRIVESGSEVANHSWRHADFSRVDNAVIEREITTTSEAIAHVTGYAPALLRTPFGVTNPRVEAVAEALGYSMVNWTVDPQDWRNRDAAFIYEHVMANTTDGDIVVLHDIRPYTVEAAERMIESLTAEGYALVTVTELLAYRYGALEPGRLYGNRTNERDRLRRR